MQEQKLYIAGHNGMVGSAIMRKFQSEGFSNIITRDLNELDLRNQKLVDEFFSSEKPEIVIVAAAKVGGILANNTYRAEFLYDNLMIEANIIHTAFKHGVSKLIFLGSSCIYPKLAPQPLKEESLLSGYLEYTNEPYAIAKIAGIKLCESYYKQYGCNFYSIMPTNMYGPYDNYNLDTSHVLPALIRKFHEGKKKEDGKRETGDECGWQRSEGIGQNNDNTQHSTLFTQHSSLNTLHSVVVWGTGKPLREFMYVEDLADSIYFLFDKVNAKDLYENNLTHLNIGTGEELSISELAGIVKKVVGYEGNIVYDSTKPDGTPRKLMDVSRIHNLGWKHKTSLEDGIRQAYNWFLENMTA